LYKVEIACAGIYQKVQVKFEFGGGPIIFDSYSLELGKD
jgi:hypothetical protein